MAGQDKSLFEGQEEAETLSGTSESNGRSNTCEELELIFTEENDEDQPKEKISSESEPVRITTEKEIPEVEFLPNMEPIKDGNLVSYKKMNTLEIVDAVINSTKYPLHKSFIGKRIGDLVVANGKRYLIVSIL